MFQLSEGVVHVELSADELMLIGRLPDLLASVGPDRFDPGYAVLHRPVYADNDAAESEFQGLVAKDTERQRDSDRIVIEGLGDGRTSMTLDEAHGFLRSVNEARLVLAARAGAFDDGDAWEDRISEDASLAAVAWLGYVQGELIAELTPHGS